MLRDQCKVVIVSGVYMLSIFFHLLSGLSGENIDPNDTMVNYNVGVLMASRLDSPFDLERCGPAVDLALEMVNDHFLSAHNVRLNKVQASYPSCSGARAPGLAADMHFKDGVIAFIGPACAFALEPVARLAAYWNRPIITGMGDQPPSEGELSVSSGILGRLHKWKNGTSGIFRNKTQYTTLTRMSYCQCRLKLVFKSIFQQFGWTYVALIVDRSDLFSLTVGKNLEQGLKREGLLAFVRELDGNDEETYDNYLKDASMYARVVILSVRGGLVRKFMLSAYALGMTQGDWTFLDVELFQGSYWSDHDWKVDDDQDNTARRAYEALLRVSLLQPTTYRYQAFADKVRTLAQLNYNYTFSDGEEVNFFIGAFYDGVTLLGMALNETLTEGGDIWDGQAITKRMWNRQFQGITGDVRIDDNGDRDADYSVLDLDPITGRFEVVATYSGAYKTYTPAPGKKIHWPGARFSPTPNVPQCGFMGTDPLCTSSTGTQGILLSIAFIVVVTLAVTLTYVAYRRMQEAADLNNMSWHMSPEEVIVQPFASLIGLQKSEQEIETSFNRPNGEGGSIISSSSLPPNQVFTNIGQYKQSRVAIKKIATKKKLDINQKLLWEIKQVRDVTHENTVRFVGACIESSFVLILTEYCPKGSLKDVLENTEIKLDWNFRMSLIHDVVKGMAYLHTSDVAVHGKLNSGNCLIDGRFVLKISDFGLKTFTTPAEVVEDEKYHNKLLWVAPEHLALARIPAPPTSQKGDVYSFAIIMEEIVTRAGPYVVARQRHMIPQEIVARVEAEEDPPFRPEIDSFSCCMKLKELMKRCWAANAEERPTFEAIRRVIRSLRKGVCENLMDDLLRRMEQYANNLEDLVEAKTEQLSHEKKRSEELLYQVLPRPVAEQLMAGQLVQPEQFECVTVYFSDIVGFTALCAKSTPMEVVDFLNELYSTFDRIIGHYDVYKVETIGDAYMVVSGLPQRNGDDHVREIALMALSIVDALKSFTVKHLPEERLKVRIGVHSGPVCAGIVGQIMPHYCLFGDTVNTASRMESTGQPLRIHVSDAARRILARFGTFELELRGEVELKGKGSLTTHWLLGCTEPGTRLHTPTENNSPFPLRFPQNTHHEERQLTCGHRPIHV